MDGKHFNFEAVISAAYKNHRTRWYGQVHILGRCYLLRVKIHHPLHYISGGKDVQKEVPTEQGITNCGTSQGDRRNAEALHSFAATV
jgi:hypothetical protein